MKKGELGAVSLLEAETLARRNFWAGRFGVWKSERGESLFNRGVVLVKLRGARHVGALRVEALTELEALRVLRARRDVEFAELDLFQERQFSPNDPLVTNQWHHSVLGSFEAWDVSLGDGSVRVAIVDTPFQMNHPDLAAQVESGWDVVDGVAITASSGIEHSTMCAGMAAAMIGNGLGVAGASRCRILPINISGAISEMYEAIVWAADRGVRVVNVSWTGGDSATLDAAGAYLKEHARGILAMPGVNGAGFLNYVNQPNIYCVAMTDAADQPRSRFGNHIDFTAPGSEIFSTTTNSGYAFNSGTSFSTPLFCGVVAALFSINPTLGPDDVIGILKSTAVDLGEPGWDQFFGFGRINYAAAALAANETRPKITNVGVLNNEIVVTVKNPLAVNLYLWKTASLPGQAWSLVPNAVVQTNGNLFTLKDTAPDEAQNFYRVEGQAP